MTIGRAVLLAFLPLAACDDYPRDTEGTVRRYAAGALRAGVVADPEATAEERRIVRRLLAEVGRDRVVEGAGEPLLLRLERGELDLVVGRFDKGTPWSARVHFSEPVRTRGEVELKMATRNGEHAWAMMVERAAAGAAEDVR